MQLKRKCLENDLNTQTKAEQGKNNLLQSIINSVCAKSKNSNARKQSWGASRDVLETS